MENKKLTRTGRKSKFAKLADLNRGVREDSGPFSGELEHRIERMKVLKNRQPQEGEMPYKFKPPSVISFCVPGDMSTCGREGNWEAQEPCFFSEKSSTSSRCMYYIFDEYCDCHEAQMVAVGQVVNLQKFKEDKKFRASMGDTDIWDEKKILLEIEKEYATKELKYKGIPVEVLQERLNEGDLWFDSFNEQYLDLKRDICYDLTGEWDEEKTRAKIVKKIRSKHDLKVKYNIQTDQEVMAALNNIATQEGHFIYVDDSETTAKINKLAKFVSDTIGEQTNGINGELQIADVLNSEFDDYMTELEDSEPCDFLLEDDIMQLSCVAGIHFDNDKKVFIVRSTGGMYERRPNTDINIYDLVGRQ